ncbi:divergent polysaccharide deacetylase family protein [Hyphobacterium marinum]|uniref:Divergent polysaccharide deacetylase family protein n=1 Tax=Hyphobacterium marinum TaxID=3116574 RepID=A0ABU7M152_9PROT|nr:divergent polysaccharide deacetylase family protein [Hyphobacterium sp. Y6023]MEE2567516.1 divergent polysaccharide deacetylase family protein [Hyphobacterium sp. Y6023]
MASPAAPVLAAGLAATAFAFGAFAFEVGAARAEPVEVIAPSTMQTASSDVSRPEAVPEAVPRLDFEAPQTQPGPLVAIVIDDAGPDQVLTSRAIALPAALTISILPYAEEASRIDAEARNAGHETFLHLPMEPGGLADPGPHALTRHHSPAEWQARVRWSLAQVPGATGLNNHMGSALTADRDAMRAILEPVAGTGLVFLDSVTSPRSRARDAAHELDIRSLSRDIFIDHDDDPAVIGRQLAAIEARARRDGRVVAIGHPRPATLDALEAWIPEAESRGLRFVTVSTLMAETGSGETVRFAGGAQ